MEWLFEGRMDFFQDYVTIGEGGHSYRGHLSFDHRSVLIPFSGDSCHGLFHSSSVLVNGSSFKLLHLSLVDSMGYGGQDKILKLTVSPECGD